MNDLSTIAKTIWQLLQGRTTFFLTWTPDLTDFRNNKQFVLKIWGKGQAIEIPVPRQHFHSFVGMLGQSIFRKDNVVIGWDLKQLFSYLKFNLPSHWRIPTYCEFVDLKLGEAFMGLYRDCPYTFEEAVRRTSVLANNPRWVNINQKIFTPLAIEVIPGIESIGITNKAAGQRQYSCYHIEGQANGRLNTKVPFDGYFNPHNLTSAEKSEFSAGHEKKFVVFDYKHMEVSVLAWLSKDERLGEIIKSGEDIYSAIYRDIYGDKSSDVKRKFIKSVFLPIVYGLSTKQLAEKVGISLNAAIALVDKIDKKFSTALGWVQAQQDQLKQSSTIRDYYGRVMDFSEGSGRNPWSVRNAVIQGPAALICLEKLINLYQNKVSSMDVVASVHDAYVCIVDSSWEIATECAKQTLELPSQLAPDCVLKVGVGVGEDWGNLAEMK